MNPIQNRTFRLLALCCMLVALAGQHAWAVGGGTPDPAGTPVLQALRVQLDSLYTRFLSVTGIIEPQDLPALTTLADELARIDAQFALAAVGGGTPDPGATTLNQALLNLRAVTGKVRERVGIVLASITGYPVFEPHARTLRYMHATTRMLIARVDYALPSGMTPPPSDL